MKRSRTKREKGRKEDVEMSLLKKQKKINTGNHKLYHFNKYLILGNWIL